jgi:hypothetical protein
MLESWLLRSSQGNARPGRSGMFSINPVGPQFQVYRFSFKCQVMQRMSTLCCTVVLVLQAIATCHCQRAAPTLTTICEIAALAAPLIRTSADSTSETAADTADAGAAASPAAASPSSRHRHAHMHVPQPVGQVGHASAAPLKLLLLLSLRLARGWAPAVVLAQGVRLVGSVVQQRENKDEAKAGREGTEGALGCFASCCCFCCCDAMCGVASGSSS